MATGWKERNLPVVGCVYNGRVSHISLPLNLGSTARPLAVDERCGVANLGYTVVAEGGEFPYLGPQANG